MYNFDRMFQSQKERHLRIRQLVHDVRDLARLLQVMQSAHDAVIISQQMKDKALELRRESAIYNAIEFFWEN